MTEAKSQQEIDQLLRGDSSKSTNTPTGEKEEREWKRESLFHKYISKGWIRQAFIIRPELCNDDESMSESLKYNEKKYIATDSLILKQLFQQRGYRDSIILHARRGYIEAETALSELAAEGDSNAMAAILKMNLFGDHPTNLWRSDAQILTQVARYVTMEYPIGGPVTEFIKEIIQNHCQDFMEFLLHSYIHYHGASILYHSRTGGYPVLLTRPRKDELRKNATPEVELHPEEKKQQTDATHKDRLSLDDLSVVSAMIYIYRPFVAYRYLGSVHDAITGRLSVIFDHWLENPLVSHAFYLQAQGGIPGDRHYVLKHLEDAINQDRLDPERFEYHRFSGFVEDLLHTISSHNEKAKKLYASLRQQAVSSNNS